MSKDKVRKRLFLRGGALLAVFESKSRVLLALKVRTLETGGASLLSLSFSRPEGTALPVVELRCIRGGLLGGGRDDAPLRLPGGDSDGTDRAGGGGGGRGGASLELSIVITERGGLMTLSLG
eukprot:CCRYP_014153-RA/>CCRYP_014153-RA protein AED:0.31 eAED:0.31 QI:2406/0.5/0.66/1/0/0/3/0/121